MELSSAGRGDPNGYVTARNGGFPEPSHGEPERVVRAAHAACGAATDIRLPHPLPANVVQRVLCSRCGHAFAADFVEDVTPHSVEDAIPRYVEGAAPTYGEDMSPRSVDDATLRYVEDVIARQAPVAPEEPRLLTWMRAAAWAFVALAAVTGALLLIQRLA